MAGEAGIGMQGGIVAFPARGTTVVHACPSFIRNARVRTGIWRIPVLGGVTGRTVQPEHANMESRVAVTARTSGGQPGKLTCGMALLTSHVHVRARQREVAQVVVEGRVLPIGRVVAGSAIRTKLTVVFIVLSMTGVTIRERARKNVVLMAILAGCIRVPAFEFERSKIVIESGGSPAVFVVAVCATEAETTFVRLVGAVTGIAVLQSHLKVAKSARIDMTLHAFHSLMLADDLE